MRRPYDDDDDFDDEDGPYVVIEKRSGGIGSFFIGLAVGAGLALLFAPQSGAATRREIRRSARRARDGAQQVAEDLTGAVQDTFETARQRVEEKLEAARDAIDTKRQQVARAMDAGRAAADQARADLERRLAETKAAYNAGARVAREARSVRATQGAAAEPTSTDGGDRRA
jgi:gas vesicle protein